MLQWPVAQADDRTRDSNLPCGETRAFGSIFAGPVEIVALLAFILIGQWFDVLEAQNEGDAMRVLIVFSVVAALAVSFPSASDAQRPCGGGQRGASSDSRGGGQRQGSDRQGTSTDVTSEVSFEQFDQNGDSLITRDEVMAIPAEQFNRVDTNNDGACDRSEFKTAMQNQRRTRQRGRSNPGDQQTVGQLMQAQLRFASLDQNDDGVISIDEVPPETAYTFSQVDTDGSGTCDIKEFTSAMQSGQTENEHPPGNGNVRKGDWN